MWTSGSAVTALSAGAQSPVCIYASIISISISISLFTVECCFVSNNAAVIISVLLVLLLLLLHFSEMS